MAMTRRNFLEAGLGGVALSLAQGASHAQGPATAGYTAGDLRTVVVGVDGSDLTVPYLDDYLSVGATVWQYSQNTIDFDRFERSIGLWMLTHQRSRWPSLIVISSPPSGRARLPWSSAFKICGRLSGSGWKWPANQGPNDWTQSTPETDLSKYYDRGLRIGNLSYQLSTSFGGGLLDPTTPLSIAGEYIVDQMQEIGILVDCSHSSEQTTLDIIKRAKRPVVFSHSDPLALNNNIRNISDDQIKGIADTGGLIGVNPVNAYLKWGIEDASNAVTGPFPTLATISQYVDVMDYIRGVVGIDYIGLGTDFTYGNPPDYAGTHFANP
jgi:hypothetical protein